MIFIAQIDPASNTLIQGLGFSTAELAQSHVTAHPEFFYQIVSEFVGPSTHLYQDGHVVRKPTI